MTDVTQPKNPVSLSREEESNLVTRIGAGDEAACNRLVTLFRPQLMTVARRFMRCEEDCDDAVQDAFISAFRAIASFEADSRLRTWLHRITVNACLMNLRRGSSRREASIEELLPAFNVRHKSTRQLNSLDDPSTEIENEEIRTVVRRAIDELPGSCRMVLVLRDIKEMDTAATAARLNLTENNVKRRLHRARLALSAKLQPILAGEVPIRTNPNRRTPFFAMREKM